MHERGDRLPRVVAGERGGRRLMERDAVVLGERQGDVDVVELDDDPDPAAIGLGREPREQFPVLPQLVVGDLQRLGVVVESHERREGMPAPQVHDVRALGEQQVEQVDPGLAVVEPGEPLPIDRVLVHLARGLDRRLLQPDGRSPQHEVGSLCQIEVSRDGAVAADLAGQLLAAVEQAGVASARDDGEGARKRGEDESLSLGCTRVVEQDLALLEAARSAEAPRTPRRMRTPSGREASGSVESVTA